MRLNWSLILKDGLVSGLIICIEILLTIRINALLFIGDMPTNMQKEIVALNFLQEPSIYEVILMSIVLFGLYLYLGFRFLNKVHDALPIVKSTFAHYALHILPWFFILFLSDLIIIDWLLYGYLKLPLFGVEHLISESSINECRSFTFHIQQHFGRPEAYIANAAIPLIMASIFWLSKKWRSKFQDNQDDLGT